MFITLVVVFIQLCFILNQLFIEGTPKQISSFIMLLPNIGPCKIWQKRKRKECYA